MSDLEKLKDHIGILLQKIEFQGISDQDYYIEVHNINLVLTNGNTAIFCRLCKF